MKFNERNFFLSKNDALKVGRKSIMACDKFLCLLKIKPKIHFDYYTRLVVYLIKVNDKLVCLCCVSLKPGDAFVLVETHSGKYEFINTLVY